MSTIQSRLQTLFHDRDHRIVLWYGNNEAEMTTNFRAAEVEGVKKIEIERNAFATKVRVLYDEPTTKFLLFNPGTVPPKNENWLLDLQLAYPVFSTDQITIYRQELGLDPVFDERISQYLQFFNDPDRRKALQQRLPLTGSLSPAQFELAIISAVTKSEPDLNEILLDLMGAAAGARKGFEEAFDAYGLTKVFWNKVGTQFGYLAATPSVKDFVKALFLTAMSRFVKGENKRTNQEGITLLGRWKDSKSRQKSYRHWAEFYGKDWKIVDKLIDRSPIELRDNDLFQEIDQVVIVGLRDALISRSLPDAAIRQLLEGRLSSYWYDDFEDYYKALGAALTFLASIPSLHLRPRPKEIIEDYTTSQYVTDGAYRQFHYHQRRAGNLLDALAATIEDQYVNSFLLPLNNNWQAGIDIHGYGFTEMPIPFQKNFWMERVKPYLDDNTTLFVIISDGLRYESAASLTERINGEGRYEASLTPMAAEVPTFTQLGMAALLPHKKLELLPTGYVMADGQPTSGTANRDKILKAHTNGRAVAMTAESFRENHTKRQGGREWIKNYDVVYLYLNLIDKAGENEEDQLFARTEESFDAVVGILSQIVGLNRYNVLITADHGYLYQTSKVQESDFATFKVTGEDAKNNRRFVIGTNLDETAGAMHFSAAELGREGDQEVMIPKSVLRLRQKGSGSRYVHGGLSLQELIVPVIRVQKKRKISAGVRSVDVELLGTSNKITSNLKTLHFFQTQPVGDKLTARTLVIGFYDSNGEPVSRLHTVTFASTEKEERLREKEIRFQFSQAAVDTSDKNVYLRMSDEGGARIDEHHFSMHISHKADFDDFDY